MFFHRVVHPGPRSAPRYFLCAAVLALTVLTCCACQNIGSNAAPVTNQIYAMDTYMELTAYGKHAESAVDETTRMLCRLDAQLDRTSPESVVYAINHSEGKPILIDPEIRALLADAIGYGPFTQGKFDISIAPLADAWGFTKDEFRVPSSDELAAIMPDVGLDHIHLSEEQVLLDPGTEIDLGGIAKGYADEQAYNIFTANGVEHALANLGGDLLVLGDKANGQPWKIGIQSPFSADDPSQYAGVLDAVNVYVLTSGSYERYFEEDGKTYHHIIDPLTGSPASTGLSSVTIISDIQPGYGSMCDVLSTALFTMGVDDAIDFWRDHPRLFQMILISDQGEVWITDGLQGIFHPSEDQTFTYFTVHADPND